MCLCVLSNMFVCLVCDLLCAVVWHGCLSFLLCGCVFVIMWAWGVNVFACFVCGLQCGGVWCGVVCVVCVCVFYVLACLRVIV